MSTVAGTRPDAAVSVDVGWDADTASTWTTATRAVAEPLRGRVVRWSGWAEQHDAPRRRREAGMAHVLLMVQLGQPLHVLGPGPPAKVRSFVAGPGTRWTDTFAEGSASGVHVELTPQAARHLLDVPLGSLTNRVVGVEEVGLSDVLELTEQVALASGWAERMDLVERLLLRRLQATHGRWSDPALAQAWTLLARGADVQGVAARVGWTRRHLTRRMQHELGLAPSQVHRLHRFARARSLLLERPERPVADVAAAAGYADHAHLVRDTQAIAGTTPSALRSAHTPHPAAPPA